MREIKFEFIYGYNGDYRKVYATLDDFLDGTNEDNLYEEATESIFDFANVSEYEMVAKRQYTGLKDKNGVEIYDGDILKLQNQYRPSGISRFKQDQLFEVQFIDGYIYCRNIKYNEQAKYYYGAELYKIHNKCEVIGSIYENKDLLN